MLRAGQRRKFVRTGTDPTVFAKAQLAAILADGNTVADYNMALGITTGTPATKAAAVANQQGIAGPLLQAVLANQPTIVGDGSILFDGVIQFMKAAPFALTQPETIYFVGRHVTWTNSKYFFDGNALNSGVLFQGNASTPQTAINAGATVAVNANLVLNTYGVGTVIFNGAGSSLKWNGTAATTGNAGAANMGGFTLGASGASLNFGNTQVKRVILRNVADSAGTQATVQAALKAIYGTP